MRKITEDDVLTGDNLIAAAILLAGRDIAYQIKYLGNGDASTPMGAIESLGAVLKDSIFALVSVIEDRK